MNKHLLRYRKISDAVINRSFPSLKNKKILYIERKMKYLGRALNFGFFNVIIINPFLRGFTDKELRGFFAHELSHIKRHKDRSFPEKISFIINYVLYKKFQKWEEREADKMAIEKGYRNELYSSRKGAYKFYKRNEKRIKADYLSLNEIKTYKPKK